MIDQDQHAAGAFELGDQLPQQPQDFFVFEMIRQIECDA